MKTIFDAVNEYKGVWMNGKSYIYVGSSHNSINEGSFQVTSVTLGNNGWDFVCTRDDFLQCVEDMTNNKGWEPINKDVMTDCTCDYCGHDWKCKLSVAQIMACPGCGDKPNKPSKPVTLSPVYTDEMRDNDILPDIGVNCMMSESRNSSNGYSGFVAGVNSGKEVYITAHFKTRTGLKMAAYFSANESKQFGGVACAIAFKAITPPIKLVDGCAYQFDYHDLKGLVGIYFKPNKDGFDILKGTFGSINAPLAAKNIKLLEVK